MDIDERIQALTMNLELLSHEHQASYQRIAQAIEVLTVMHQENERRFTTLERIALAHEQRIEDLERRRPA